MHVLPGACFWEPVSVTAAASAADVAAVTRDSFTPSRSQSDIPLGKRFTHPLGTDVAAQEVVVEMGRLVTSSD
jgi:hypothetical protein